MRFKRIDREAYLQARLGYLATMRAKGASLREMMSELGGGDPLQVELLLLTVEDIESGRLAYNKQGLLISTNRTEDK